MRVLKAQEILDVSYGVAADVWSVTSYKELYRDANDCERLEHVAFWPDSEGPVRDADATRNTGTVHCRLRLHEVLPESISQWVPGSWCPWHRCFGAARAVPLAHFFEVDAKHIVLGTLVCARERETNG